jgi:predicted NBD/HSP70 family sugar kinase
MIEPNGGHVSYRTGSAGLSRDLNRVANLRLIGTGGPIARASIAERLGLSPATVTSITRELIESGLIRIADRAPSKGGRPALLLEIVGGAAAALGVKVAPDHVVGVLVDLDAGVIDQFEEQRDVAAPDGFDRVTAALQRWVKKAEAKAPLLGVGLGVPGIVDGTRGTVTSPLIGWRDFDVRSRLQEALHVPVLVDNDVNTLAVFERLYGRGRDAEDFVAITLGRGVGLGIVAAGDIYHGFRGGAGEFGHVTAVPGGPTCSCGKRGCLEAIVGDPALVHEARAQGVVTRRQGLSALRRKAADGDTGALGIYGRAGEVLGQTVAGLVNVLSPQLVLISGEGTDAWPYISASFERSLRSNLFSPLRDVAVEVDPWDDAKWAVGAAALVLRATFTPLVDGSRDELAMRAWLRAESPAAEVVA